MVRTILIVVQIGHRDAEVTSRDAEGDCHSAAGLGAAVALTELTTPEREH